MTSRNKSNNSFQRRVTIDIELSSLNLESDGSRVSALDFSKVRLKFKSSVFLIDIGALCYTQCKKEDSKKSSNYNKLVIPSSIIVVRKDRIKNLIYWFYTEIKLGSKEKTLIEKFNYFKNFIIWSDKNEYFDVLNNNESAGKYFRLYVGYLREKVRGQKISLLTAVSKQNNTLIILSEALGVDKNYIIQGFVLLRSNVNATKNTESPSVNSVKKQISIYQAIFDRFTDILINKIPLPAHFKLPEDSVWIMPCKKIFATNDMLKNRSRWKMPYWAYDFEHGGVVDVNNIMSLYNGKTAKSSAISAVQRAKDFTMEVNNDPFHPIRIQILTHAQSAFINLMLVNTGMNSQQLFTLEWRDDISVEKSEQGFKFFKARAKNKIQVFKISSYFYPTFKKFLELRKFALQNETYNYLFFTCNINGLEKKPIGATTFYSFIQKKMSVLFDEKPITPREWRTFKANILLNQTKGDVITIAKLLQNDPETIIRSYANGNMYEATNQFGEYFKKLKLKLKKRSEYENQVEIAVGHCNEVNSPKPEKNTVNKPDCKQMDYCLFCENFAIHADRIDIKKLLSLKYVINESRSLSSSEEHFQNLFGDVILRIDGITLIISELSYEHDKMVKEVESEVEMENLTVYWQGKLNVLVDIGAL